MENQQQWGRCGKRTMAEVCLVWKANCSNGWPQIPWVDRWKGPREQQAPPHVLLSPRRVNHPDGIRTVSRGTIFHRSVWSRVGNVGDLQSIFSSWRVLPHFDENGGLCHFLWEELVQAIFEFVIGCKKSERTSKKMIHCRGRNIKDLPICCTSECQTVVQSKFLCLPSRERHGYRFQTHPGTSDVCFH